MSRTDSKVGYGRPPVENQYQPGQSGNNRGAPKRAPSQKDILKKIGFEKVKISENGRSYRISKLEAVFRRLTHDALTGDQGAYRVLMGFRKIFPSEKPQGPIVVVEIGRRELKI